MQYKERVPDELFTGEHYLGRPADITDKIVGRRIALLEQYPGFAGKQGLVEAVIQSPGRNRALLRRALPRHAAIAVDAHSMDK